MSQLIETWAQQLGFSHVGISTLEIKKHYQFYLHWLESHYHGEMSWISRHQELRLHPELFLYENSSKVADLRMISVTLNYLPEQHDIPYSLKTMTTPYVSRYALGNDYHKLMRKRLQLLANKIEDYCKTDLNLSSPFLFRPLVDSAPVLEGAFAEKAQLGFIGKHSLLINQQEGSYFFIGELLVNLALPVTSEAPIQKQIASIDSNLNKQGCGRCTACQTICPTEAIVDDYIVDARRCISYLTIEYKGIIPEQFRDKIGNRIYGCDDCQLVCPYNKQPSFTKIAEFEPRSFHKQPLIELFQWSETQFLDYFTGSPIRRIGYWQWLRNISIALGNIPFQSEDYQKKIIETLQSRLSEHDLLEPHIHWAIERQSDQYLKERAENRQQQRLSRIAEHSFKDNRIL